MKTDSLRPPHFRTRYPRYDCDSARELCAGGRTRYPRPKKSVLWRASRGHRCQLRTRYPRPLVLPGTPACLRPAARAPRIRYPRSTPALRPKGPDTHTDGLAAALGEDQIPTSKDQIPTRRASGLSAVISTGRRPERGRHEDQIPTRDAASPFACKGNRTVGCRRGLDTHGRGPDTHVPASGARAP